MKNVSGFSIVVAGRSVYVSVTNNVMEDFIIEVDGTDGFVSSATILGVRRLWYVTRDSEVRIHLADPNSVYRKDWWDFIYVQASVERDESNDDSDSDFYDVMFEMVFEVDRLRIVMRLIDNEDDGYLVDEEVIFDAAYYGKQIEKKIRHPKGSDVIYLKIVSEINE